MAIILKLLIITFLNLSVLYILLYKLDFSFIGDNNNIWKVIKDLILLNIALIGALKIRFSFLSYDITANDIEGNFQVGETIPINLDIYNRGYQFDLQYCSDAFEFLEVYDIDTNESETDAFPVLDFSDCSSWKNKSIYRNTHTMTTLDVRISSSPFRHCKIKGEFEVKYRAYSNLNLIIRNRRKSFKVPFSIEIIGGI